MSRAPLLVSAIYIIDRNGVGSRSCVEILDWFAIGNHVCMVFPLLGTSLLTYIEKVKHCPLDHLRDFAWQLLVGLARSYFLSGFY